MIAFFAVGSLIQKCSAARCRSKRSSQPRIAAAVDQHVARHPAAQMAAEGVVACVVLVFPVATSVEAPGATKAQLRLLLKAFTMEMTISRSDSRRRTKVRLHD